MNRVQKKCLFASVALHGLLAAIIIVGPAFLPRKPQPPDLPILIVIPNKLIDEAFYGGDNPNGRLPVVQPPVQQPAPPAPAPAPAQPAPAPQPEPVRPEPRPAPRQPEAVPPAPKAVTPPTKEPTPVTEVAKPAGKEADDRAAPSKSAIKVSTKLTRPRPGDGTSNPKPTVRVGSQTQGRADSQARNQAAASLQSGVSRVVDRLSSNLSSGTSIEPFGPGGGGEVYANWFQAVQSLYDAAWHDPVDVTDELATVRVRVKVARNGTVLADDIVKRTGIRALDQSVQEALDRVRASHLPPLPESATESERTFYINFNLKSKRQLG